MTKEQAIMFIVQVAGLAPVNKQTHLDVEKAAKLLLEALKEKENG